MTQNEKVFEVVKRTAFDVFDTTIQDGYELFDELASEVLRILKPDLDFWDFDSENAISLDARNNLILFVTYLFQQALINDNLNQWWSGYVGISVDDF
jgi:hypothetical protein